MNDLEQATHVVSGAIAMGYIVAALYFFRFWRQTRDRLFAYFGAAFVMLLVQRVALTMTYGSGRDTLWVYLLRLLAFVLIGIAIIEKNRARGR